MTVPAPWLSRGWSAGAQHECRVAGVYMKWNGTEGDRQTSWLAICGSAPPKTPSCTMESGVAEAGDGDFDEELVFLQVFWGRDFVDLVGLGELHT